MDLIQQQERLQKWAKLIALTDAIGRARQGGELVIRKTGKSHRKYDHYAASEIQHLEQQRKALRATMPIRVVQ